MQSEPGKALNLTAVVAPTPKAAADYYPSQCWRSLLQVPGASEFPGTGAGGNGISPNVKSQAQWIQDTVGIDTCTGCHQLGNKATRTIPASLGVFDSSVAAWERRIQSGQAGAQTVGRLNQAGWSRALAMYAGWADRIAAGEYPTAPPPRPHGIEHHVVISMWDWADPKAYLHDEISSDKRNPRVNVNGPLYGALEASADYMLSRGGAS